MKNSIDEIFQLLLIQYTPFENPLADEKVNKILPRIEGESCRSENRIKKNKERK